MSRLGDNVALITGAGQGIGRAFALRFAAEGARVVVADLNGERAAAVAAELAAAGGQALAVTANVADEASVAAMVQEAVAHFGRLDVLLNNAAIFSTIEMKPFYELSLAEWQQLMAVNLTGVFLCCRAAAGPMRARQRGRIINISSSTVLMGRPNYAHYVASKAGVIGLTRAMATELGGDNITVNAIMPGSTETEIPRATVTPAQVEGLLARQAIHRRGTPADLVGAAVFLASDESGFITGQTLVIDGGHNYL